MPHIDIPGPLLPPDKDNPQRPPEPRPEEPDAIKDEVDRMFLELLFAPRSDIAEEVLQAAGQLAPSEQLTQFSDDELKLKIQAAAIACQQDRQLLEKIAQIVNPRSS